MNGYSQDAIMVVGDSLTQAASDAGGFAQRLSHVYQRKFDVLNRGFGGYNSTWTLAAFKQCIAKRDEVTPHTSRIRLLIVWLGANDSVLPWREQYVPLSLFTENLTDIVHTVSSPSSEYYFPDTKIILLTPPPINTHQRGADLAKRGLELDRDFNQTAQYAEAVREVSRKENIPLVDVYTRLWEGCGKEEKNLTKYMTDGLHVNVEAYTVIFDGIMEVIQTHYPELHHDKLQPVFPFWYDINPGNPKIQKRTII